MIQIHCTNHGTTFHLVPRRYGLIGSQLGDVTDSYVEWTDGQKITVQEFLVRQFSIHHDFIGWAAFILIGFILTFIFCVVYGYMKLNWQKR